MAYTYVDLFKTLETKRKALRGTVIKLGNRPSQHWKDWRDLNTQLVAWENKAKQLLAEDVNCRREKRETAKFKKLDAALKEIEYAIEGNIMIYMLKNGVN